MSLTIVDTLQDGTQKTLLNDVAGNLAELKAVGPDKALKVAVIESVSSASVTTTATLSQVAAAVTSTQLLTSNANRRGIMLYNDSTKIAYVAFAATASTSAFSIKLPPGSLYEKEEPIYTGTISAVWSGANGNMQITELS